MRFFNRNILLHRENGDRNGLILPMEKFKMHFNVPERNFPVRHTIRIMGEPDYFWKWRCEAGSPYSIATSIEDTLTTGDTPREKFAMRLECHGEPFPRHAYMKLSQNEFIPGAAYRLVIPAKGSSLSFGSAGCAEIRLEIHLAKEGRHPDDLYDPPEIVEKISLPAGNYPWSEFRTEFVMPENAVCLLLDIHVKDADGTLLLGSPKLYAEGADSILPDFDHQQARNPRYNYVGENLSRRDWVEFELSVDGKTLFRGEKYSSIVRRPEMEIELGTLEAGPHLLEFTLTPDYESAVGFLMQQLELLEYGNHDFELIGAPEFIEENQPFHVLVRTAAPNVKLRIGERLYVPASAGLHGLTVIPSRNEPAEYVIESDTFRDSFRTTKIPRLNRDIRLAGGDIIFIPHTAEDTERYLEWYFSNNIGNALTFRHSYRWGGGRIFNPDLWKTALPVLHEMGCAYSLMIDGRELPGKNCNPPDTLLNGPGYLGRQAHENDGAFYYWGNALWQDKSFPEPMGDILSRSIDKGGIQPHVRPKRKGKRAWWFFDPTEAENCREAAQIFVRNLADARGDSIRHSGPSTLFRYFFQAGYRFLLAEQMYGPEEVVLSALRGASSAYHAAGFGVHLAVQWSSTPHDTPEHAGRYFLSLCMAYLQGATHLQIEEGLYRMEKNFADYDRFSGTCLRHLAAHTRFRRFLEIHPRDGALRVKIACIQGRYDGWCCFSRDNIWKREGDAWKFGAPEESFDLLRLFFPRSRLDSIYRCPCPVAPQGWYTGTPFGPIDLAPFEGCWDSYDAVFFLGWHTWEDGDGEKMLEYVKKGGHLLLAKPHLSMAVGRTETRCYPVHDQALAELLGTDWHDERNIRRRKVGAGEVILFGADHYPAELPIRASYEKHLAELADVVLFPEREKGWVESGEDVEFTVYDRPDGVRVIYLLNIRWWDRNEAEVILHLRGREIPLRIPEGDIHIVEIHGDSIRIPDALKQNAISHGQRRNPSACAENCP